jgi:hypothetical protein
LAIEIFVENACWKKGRILFSWSPTYFVYVVKRGFVDRRKNVPLK